MRFRDLLRNLVHRPCPPREQGVACPRTGGEPLWCEPHDLAIFVSGRDLAKRRRSRRLPGITQRKILVQRPCPGSDRCPLPSALHPGPFSGAACSHIAELPSYKAAPLEALNGLSALLRVRSLPLSALPAFTALLALSCV